MDNDTVESGGETLSLDEAAKAYAAVTQTREPQGQPDPDDTGEDTAEDTDELEADAEGDAEEDGEPETEGQPEDEDGEEPESEKGRYVAHNGRVKLPDGSESTIADLIAGNMKDRDYRQKTMAHAEDVKSFKAQSEALKASQQQIEQDRALAAQLITAIVGEPPPISMTDPNSPDFDIVGYNQRKASHEAWSKYLTDLQQQSEAAERTKAETASKSEREKADTEWTTLLQVKGYEHLRDEKKAQAFTDSLKTYLSDFGFQQADLRPLALDHRLAILADKARRFDKLQASKDKVQKKIENRPPVQKGGRRLNPNEARARAVSDATSRLQQTGRLDDAVAAYLATQK